jgi:hypothetical protein
VSFKFSLQCFVLIHFQLYPFFMTRDRVSNPHKINKHVTQRKHRTGDLNITHLRSEPTPKDRDTTYRTISVVNHKPKILKCWFVQRGPG